MKVSILTLFPDMFKGPFDASIVKRAIDKKLLDIDYVDIRDFGKGSHKMVDDTPYGGGSGMILRVDVVLKAIEKAKASLPKRSQRVVLLTPTGTTYNQKKAREYARLKHLILVCGHYEGVDGRIDNFVDEKISIGDFVLTGGEIPAMLIIDSIARLLKGLLKEGVVETESFSPHLEYPQFTKPQTFKGLSVPKVLLSGNHKRIDEWRREESHRITKRLRPDLLKTGK